MIFVFDSYKTMKIFHDLHLINTILNTVLWIDKIDAGYCPNSDYFEVPNQVGCQQLCEKKTTCTGISYGGNASCRTCDDDKLSFNHSSYDFYKRPGKSLFDM